MKVTHNNTGKYKNFTLVSSCWRLVSGCWFLVAGFWLPAAGG
ncbi:hypothetical protein C900_04721 [Fulvivirga imtechensis AK7]|uniref:Uncharacterized protein n=1 Tax=Fulvivirga imtechensis AK7 TaxID=1237149 RepID=L8JQL0_9BACT|nr:hypothetical protein C900_04721 [Fulvivirga imtechensis AK7]